MNKNKNKIKYKKKGFTLVELIVVMAIIAILAAVAVPTTMHFVEKAHETNDQVLIDISGNLGGYFVSLNMATTSLNIADKDVTTNELVKEINDDIGTIQSRQYINTITINLSNKTDYTCDVDVTIKGKKEASKVQTITKYVGTFGFNDFLNGVAEDEIPNSVVFTFTNGIIDTNGVEVVLPTPPTPPAT